MAKTKSELRSVSQDIATTQAALTELDAQKLDAEQSIASLKQQATGIAAELEGLKQEHATTLSALSADRERLSTLQDKVGALEDIEQATVAKLDQKLQDLLAAEKELAAVQSRLQDIAPKPLPDTGAALEPRPEAIVDSALLGAPGLDALTELQADALRTALIDGHCVADALKATTGRANPFTVRALRRSVGACAK